MIKEEVLLTQRVFRELMNAMAFPGVWKCLPEDCVKHIAYTLLDEYVSFFSDDEELTLWIERRTKSKRVAPHEADFLFLRKETLPSLKVGTPEYPDKGATVIRLLKSEGEMLTLLLRGPGIEDFRVVEVQGLSPWEVKLIGELNRNFPLGVDFVFVREDCCLFGLPRSVKVEVI